MGDSPQQFCSSKDVGKACMAEVPPQKIEQLRNRPEKSAAEKCKENHAVSEELKKQITELSAIRKSDTVEARLQKIDGAITTLNEQSKPLRKALNSTLVSTDTELLEIVAQTTREALLEIGGSLAIDPVESGRKIAEGLDRAQMSVKHSIPDKSEWCSEWIFDDDSEKTDELFNEVFTDSEMLESHRFGNRFGFFHRHHREFATFSGADKLSAAISEDGEETSIEPVVWPFNAEIEFVLQLVEVECVEKVKKIREKLEKTSKKPTAELVKVNDKASNVQSEEVSITRELHHVLAVFKKELKSRRVDQIPYYEFVTNPESFSRTVENMFYVSYLMRDREVFLIEVNGVPTLKKPRDEATVKQLTEACSWHGVTSLSHEQWVRLSKAFTKSMIVPLD